MFSSITTGNMNLSTRTNPILVEGTTGKWNNAVEVNIAHGDSVPYGKWIWFKAPIQSNNFGIEPPFDGMISTKIDLPAIEQISKAFLQLKLYDPDGLIKYARAIVNDKIIINMGDWKLRKDTMGEIDNLQEGANYILLEFKMKKKYPFTKILLGTLRQTAVSANIQVFSDEQ